MKRVAVFVLLSTVLLLGCSSEGAGVTDTAVTETVAPTDMDSAADTAVELDSASEAPELEGAKEAP